MVWPTLISVSVAPVSYFFCASAGAANVTPSATSAAVNLSRAMLSSEKCGRGTLPDRRWRAYTDASAMKSVGRHSGPAPRGASRNDGVLYSDPRSDRRKLRFIPDADQDTMFDLQLLVGVGRDPRVAGGDVVLRMQRPVEQRGLQPRHLAGAGRV